MLNFLKIVKDIPSTLPLLEGVEQTNPLSKREEIKTSYKNDPYRKNPPSVQKKREQILIKSFNHVTPVYYHLLIIKS